MPAACLERVDRILPAEDPRRARLDALQAQLPAD